MYDGGICLCHIYDGNICLCYIYSGGICLCHMYDGDICLCYIYDGGIFLRAGPGLRESIRISCFHVTHGGGLSTDRDVP